MGAVTRAGFRTRSAFLAVLSVTVYLLVFVLLSALAHAELNIVLKNDFIEKYKDRATITARFTVVAASKVHPASQDADIHIAGRSEDIGLPVVAEIMNAKGSPAALKAVKAGENSGEPVPVIGAWRIWAEHGDIDDQVQGAPVTDADSNPPHVFQIHPVSQFDNKS